MRGKLINFIRICLNSLLFAGLVLMPIGSGNLSLNEVGGKDTPLDPYATTITGPALNVDAAASQHAISPYIYGLNFAKESFASEINLPVRRWGGNATSRYNWQNGDTNTANDWYFENEVQYNPYTNTNENHTQWIAQNVRTGTDSLITIPMIGFVAKDGTNCSFSISKYGSQNGSDASRPGCGNGVKPDGSFVTGNDPADTSQVVDQTFMKNWVQSLVTNYGNANKGGIKFYSLDNEPDLWGDTHRDVHPSPQTYDELLSKTEAYAAAIKAADPSSKIFGYSSFGWTGYWYSEYDILTAAKNGYTSFPDYQSHGNLYQVQWYLDQLHKYEQTNGTRLLDYLDLHYYPENGASLTTAGDANMQALRLRSTRSLWDSTYRDESWIGGSDQPADWRYVHLIPRMKDWVNTYYPGTKLSISEYNWGGLESMNGALAQADVLGIFGREGLDLATLWNYPNSGDGLGYDHFETEPGAYAFRLYRNYDGNGNTFGDTSIQAASTNQDQLSIYAAKRNKDGALTLMVINKTSQTLTSSLALTNFQTAANAQVYQYSSSNLSAIVHEPNLAVTPSGFTTAFPLNSITLIIIPFNNTPPVTISGNAGTGGVTLSYMDGSAKTVTSANDGSYSFTVPTNWSGTVTPSKLCTTFNPVSLAYNSITTNQSGQDYSPTSNSPCGAGSGVYDDGDTNWVYSSGWTSHTGTGPYNKTDHYIKTVGGTAAFTFTGNGFIFTYVAATNRGKIQVNVDGNPLTTINARSSSTVWQKTYISPAFAPGTHIITFTHAGPANTYIDIDAIKILNAYDDANPAWTYSPGWLTFAGAGPYNRTDHYTKTVGANASFTFTGTGFTFDYVTAVNRGNITVNVDGNVMATLNGKSTATVWQKTYTSPILSAGAHTVTFTHAGPPGKYIDVDVIQITP